MTTAAPHQPHCPYCLSAVVPADDSVVCSACGIPHHRECWQLNGRCTTYGCYGRPVPVSPDPDSPAAAALSDWELPPISLTREQILSPAPAATPARQQAEERARERGVRSRARADARAWRALALAFGLLAALLVMAGLVGSHDDPPRQATPQTPVRPLPPGRPLTPQSRLVTRACNLRVIADEHAQPGTAVEPQDIVELQRTKGDWAYVELDSGESGYVPRSALATLRSAPPKPPPGRQP